MERLGRLLLLLLLPINALAQNYCSIGGGAGSPDYSTVQAYGTYTLTQCQQMVCNIWPTMAGCSGAAPKCVPLAPETQTIACPAGYVGSTTQTRQSYCPDTYSTSPLWGPWVTTASTCVRLPTCQVSSESQSLSCPTGYTGSITQTRMATCPDPYGAAVWGAWTTTSNSCVKTLVNPTNPSSPVSPLNPTSPLALPPPPPPPAAPPPPPPPPPSAPPPPQERPRERDSGGAPARKDDKPAPPQDNTKQEASLGTGLKPPTPGKTLVPGFGLVMSLELFVKPGLKQPDVFPIFELQQRQDDETRRRYELFESLFLESDGDLGDALHRDSERVLRRIHRNNSLQRDGLGD